LWITFILKSSFVKGTPKNSSNPEFLQSFIKFSSKLDAESATIKGWFYYFVSFKSFLSSNYFRWKSLIALQD
jgi:hypothetical protein